MQVKEKEGGRGNGMREDVGQRERAVVGISAVEAALYTAPRHFKLR